MPARPFARPGAVLMGWTGVLLMALAAVLTADRALMQHGLALRADDPRYYLGEAERLADLNDRLGALANLHEGMRRAPDAAETQRVAGDVHFHFHEWPQAETAYRAALAAGDPAPATRANLLWALIRQEKVDEAARVGEGWLAEGRDDPAVLRYTAEALLRANRPAEALPLFERALQHTPGDLYVLGQMEQAYRATGDPAKADATLDRIQEIRAGLPALEAAP